MASPHDVSSWDALSPLYERLLTHCPPLRFPPPWDFLPAPEQCRGPVSHPPAALADLRDHFEEATLRKAKILTPDAKEGARFNPLFAGPDAALILLRDSREGPLRGLLTRRGCLPDQRLAIDAALTDHATREALSLGGVLFATPDIHETAVLRALGLPATLSFGLDRLRLSGLNKLNVSFKHTPPPRGGASRPTLALVGWSPLSLDLCPSTALISVIEHLTQARQFLKVPLSGVRSWRMNTDDLMNLQFRLRLRNVSLVQMLLRKSAHALEDMATLLPPTTVGASTESETRCALPLAEADLLAQLIAAPVAGPPPESVRRAMEHYEKQVQRALIEPLQDWALARSDAVPRNIGMHLTRVCQLLHGMSPHRLELQARQFEIAQAALEPLPTKALAQYLALTGRLGNLLRDVRHWEKT